MSLLQAALLPSNLKQRILESGANFLLPQYTARFQLFPDLSFAKRPSPRVQITRVILHLIADLLETQAAAPSDSSGIVLRWPGRGLENACTGATNRIVTERLLLSWKEEEKPPPQAHFRVNIGASQSQISCIALWVSLSSTPALADAPGRERFLGHTPYRNALGRSQSRNRSAGRYPAAKISPKKVKV